MHAWCVVIIVSLRMWCSFGAAWSTQHATRSNPPGPAYVFESVVSKQLGQNIPMTCTLYCRQECSSASADRNRRRCHGGARASSGPWERQMDLLDQSREYLGTGYGLRFSTEIYGSKRFSTNTYRSLALFLQKSPKISGNLQEFTGECNLDILYSSSLLSMGNRIVGSTANHRQAKRVLQVRGNIMFESTFECHTAL